MNVPNLPTDPIVDNKGILTTIGKNFFEQLIKELFINFSNEGLVSPTQSDSNVTTIQNNQNSKSQYTTPYGTLLYNSTNNSLMVALNNGSNAPIFMNLLTAIPGPSSPQAFLLL